MPPCAQHSLGNRCTSSSLLLLLLLLLLLAPLPPPLPLLFGPLLLLRSFSGRRLRVRPFHRQLSLIVGLGYLC